MAADEPASVGKIRPENDWKWVVSQEVWCSMGELPQRASRPWPGRRPPPSGRRCRRWSPTSPPPGTWSPVSPVHTRQTHAEDLTRHVTGSTWCKSHKNVPDLASSNPPMTAHHDSQFMTAYKRSHMCVKSSLKPWLSAFLTRFWSLRDQRRWPLPP